MRIYTVHCRHLATDPDRDLTLVKEGFSWPAFFFGFLWAVWHRMWWVALGLFVAGIAFDALLTAATAAPGLSWLGFAAITGWIANDLRRWHLRRQGMAETDIVAARDEDSACLRFLDSNPALASDLYGGSA